MPATEPAGFTRVYAEDFTTAAALGTFTPGAAGSATDGRLPTNHPYYNSISCYPDNFGYPGDLSNGRYYSSKVFSAQTGVANANGVLDQYLHMETVDGANRVLSGWFVPYISGRGQYFTYGRFSIRMRADLITGVGGVHLLIPDAWPQKGEIDYPEGPFQEAPVHGFNHFADPAATSGTSGNYQQQVNTPAATTWQDWHVYTIEWTPGQLKWYLDGALIYNTTDRVSDAPNKYVPFQSGINGTTVPVDGTAGHVQIDWVTVADYTG